MMAQLLIIDIIQHEFQRLQKQLIFLFNLACTVADEVHRLPQNDRRDGLVVDSVSVDLGDEVR